MIKTFSEMGNRNVHTVQPFEEQSQSEKRNLLVVPSPTKYSAITEGDLTKPPQHSIQQTSPAKQPVQASQNGTLQQNKLVLDRKELPYTNAAEDRKEPLKQMILCRSVSGVVVFVLLVCSAAALVTVLLKPSDHSLQSRVEGSVVALLADVNPFWFESATISRVDKTLYGVYVGWVSCDELHTYHTEVVSNTHSRTATKDYYQQLEYFEPYSYLVEGSRIELDINITSSPASRGENVSLVVYTDFNDYINAVTHYRQSILLNSTEGESNRINLNITDTSFYFFAVSTPTGTDFTYNFTLDRVSYNDSDVDRQCYIEGDESCKLNLNKTHCVSCSKQCLMSYCVANTEAFRPFYLLRVDFKRRRLNWIVGILIPVVVSLAMIFIAIGVYDVIKFKLFPLGKKSLKTIKAIFRRHEQFKN